MVWMPELRKKVVQLCMVEKDCWAKMPVKISQDILKFFDNIFGLSVEYFMIKDLVKNFILVFFLTIIVFLILMKLKKILKIKHKVNIDKLWVNTDETMYYQYKNARNKKEIQWQR